MAGQAGRPPLEAARAVVVVAAPEGDAEVAQPLYTAAIVSASRKKHPLLLHLQVVANYPLLRAYTPSLLAKTQPREGFWVWIRPKDPALHDDALKLSWKTSTSSTVIAQQLVGNPFSKQVKHRLPRVNVRGIDAESTAAGCCTCRSDLLRRSLQRRCHRSRPHRPSCPSSQPPPMWLRLLRRMAAAVHAMHSSPW